jgi:hypothetical protein
VWRDDPSRHLPSVQDRSQGLRCIFHRLPCRNGQVIAQRPVLRSHRGRLEPFLPWSCMTHRGKPTMKRCICLLSVAIGMVSACGARPGTGADLQAQTRPMLYGGQREAASHRRRGRWVLLVPVPDRRQQGPEVHWPRGVGRAGRFRDARHAGDPPHRGFAVRRSLHERCEPSVACRSHPAVRHEHRGAGGRVPTAAYAGGGFCRGSGRTRS